ncbi:protein kinase [Archangium primigenium]|nr:serine/threonine-protein kinase [Archangium primigenium]MBM7112160.1 protein kinase [Archangium primigenium]
MRCPVCYRRLSVGVACALHGAPPLGPAVEAEPWVPPEVPGLRLGAPLGTGGFSRVYGAVREADGREVALKVSREASRGDFSERFAREAAALRRVGAPTVPALLGEGQVAGHPFLVLERLRGQTLAEALAAWPGTGALPLERVRALLADVGAAVARVHQAGVVHRDLKPENLFLRADGPLGVLDLGLARFREDGAAPDAAPVHLTRTGQRLGTPFYMAPEQCQESPDVDPRADLYALGVLLFEWLTGAPPFTGGPDEVLHGHVNLRPPRVSERAPVPRALDDVLARALAKERAARFGSVAELLAAFDAACQATPRAPEAVPEPTPARARGVRSVALLGVAGEVDLLALAEAVAPEGGLLARLHPERALVAFPEHPSAEAGLRAALRAARALDAPDTRRVLHVAPLWVRPGAAVLRLAGEALEHPEHWWPVDDPADSETAPRPTPEAAAHLTDGADEATAPVSTEPPPLFGREALLDTLAAHAARAFTEASPGLTRLLGEPGQGKSRVLDALALRLEPGARVVRLTAPPPDTGAPEALLQALWALATPGQRPPATPPGARRHALSRALATSLQALARPGPLALLVDDAHQADPTALEVLEMATLPAPDTRLWVCAAARPELLGPRPAWGERAGLFAAVDLPPLDGEARRGLLRHLLHPAEFIPAPVLEHLETLTQGVPLSLVEVAEALRASGTLRTAAGGEGYVAADALLHVSVTPLFERLAARALALLPASHRGLAELCAVLGPEPTVARLDAAQRHLEPLLESSPEAARAARLDAGAGLARLARAGLLRAVDAERYAFRQPQVREALERALPGPWRRALHTAALRALGPDTEATRRPRALHAAASGAHEEAFHAWFALGEAARRAHRHVEAEQDYTHALAQLPETEPARRAQVLAGRGRVRYRTHRFREALADLSAARALAQALRDTALEVDLLLEEATLVDWLEDAEGSAARTQEALDKAEALDDPRLSVRCALARARHTWRQGDWTRATRLLTATVESATLARDTETRIIALMMQGTGLALAGDEPSSAAAFDEALGLCQREGDALHRAATLINRTFLWRLRGDLAGAERELREAIHLGRELGHAQVERWSLGQLAECLHWMGREREALGLAERAHALGERFFREHPVAVDAVLLARVHAALGEEAGARAQLDWLSAHCAPEATPPNTRLLWRMVALRVHDMAEGQWNEAAWTALAAEAEPDCSGDELTEVFHQAALGARAVGRAPEAHHWLERARSTAAASPLWGTRLDALREDWETTPLPPRV